jgi:phage baseplate assembly protein V
MNEDYGSGRESDHTSYNLVRCGRVVDRRYTSVGPQVKVMYDDREVESDWLPVGQSGSKGHVFYTPPQQIGDQVTVLHYPTGIEKGIVVCTNPTLRTPSFKPRSINSVALQSLDGSYFEYDPDQQCLSINGIATIYLKSSGQIQIVCGGDLDATVTGNVEVSCKNLDATCSGEATVTAPTITLKGNVEITGTLQVDNNLTVNGSTTTVQNLTIAGTESGGGST